MQLAGPARCFRDLIVWQKAHDFVLAVYAFTAGFPKHETYGLSMQLRLFNAYSGAILNSSC